MRILLRMALFLAGFGGLAAALVVEPVPAGQVGIRGEGAAAEGLRVRLPLTEWSVRPVRGRLTFGPPGDARLLAVAAKDGARVGLALTVDWQLVGSGAVPPTADALRGALTKALAAHFGALTLRELSTPLTLEQSAVDARPRVDAALAPMQVAASNVSVHGLRLPPEVDAKLRGELLAELQAAVQAARSESLEAKSHASAAEGAAGTQVETVQRAWDEKDADARRVLQTEIDGLRAEADAYARTKQSESEAAEAQSDAEGKLALARAAALRDKLTADALAGDAGRLYTAIEAARTFEVGTLDPALRGQLTSMAAWRRFFLRQP